MLTATPPCPLCNGTEPRHLQIPEPSIYFACPACDLHFLHPDQRLSADKERSRYLLHENSLTDIGYQIFVKPLFDEIVRHFPRTSIGLDFGSGHSPVLAELLKQRGYSIQLYDPFFCPNPGALDHKYDFVVACEVAEHFFEPASEFIRLRRLVKDGGSLFLMTLLVEPQKQDFTSWYYRKDPTHVVFYSANTIRWIAQRFGFSQFEIVNRRVVRLF